MVEKKDEKLGQREPQAHYVIFGDGGYAKVLKRKDHIRNKEGGEIVRFVLKPSSNLVQRFNIQDKEILQGWIKKEYPANMVHLAGMDPTNQVTFILCDWEGNQTVLTHLNSTWLIQNEYLQKEVTTLRMALAVSQENERNALESAAKLVEAQDKVRKKFIGKEQYSWPGGPEQPPE